MKWPRSHRYSNRGRILLAVFSVVLGVLAGVLILLLPDSPPAVRLMAIWRPGFRDAHRGSDALDHGDPVNARTWFDRALDRESDGPAAAALLDAIINNCRRHQSWSLMERYAHRALDRRNLPVDQLRYAEALLGVGRFGAASAYLESLLKLPVSRGAPAGSRLMRERVQRDLAYLLAITQKDLVRARVLAEDGILGEMQAGGNGTMLASLDDVLAWIYYQGATRQGTRPSLELSRIYAESAADLLDENTDPSVASTVLYHLSRIYGSLGNQTASQEAYASARRASQPTVDWLAQIEATRR